LYSWASCGNGLLHRAIPARRVAPLAHIPPNSRDQPWAMASGDALAARPSADRFGPVDHPH
jgi:hypothetical protein